MMIATRHTNEMSLSSLNENYSSTFIRTYLDYFSHTTKNSTQENSTNRNMDDETLVLPLRLYKHSHADRLHDFRE